MSTQDFRTWLAIGTGVGIEIGRDDLEITVARVRPGGVKVLGSLSIHKFRETPAAEWGSVYSAFLRKLGQRHLAAQVLLPRDAVIVRQILLPGVKSNNLGAALKYQIDSLHPYPEDDVVYDFARIGNTPSILIGISRRSIVDEYATLFAEAGVKISAFTFSASTLYSAVRMLGTPPASGFLALGAEEGEVEAYGESPARPLFSARVDQSFERARALALAELRLPPETEAAAIADVLPQPKAAPADYNLSRSALVYATAVAGACPLLSLTPNLLPVDLRKSSSRLIYVPTIVLSALVVLMAIALSAYSGFEDKRYLGQLQVEIQRVQAQARVAGVLETKIATTRNRAQSLDSFRKHLKDDLTAINDLSNLLAPPIWLTSLNMTRDAASVSGEAPHAEALLKLLDSSKQFRRSEFTLPIANGPGGEVFSIHVVREGVTP